MVRSPTRPLALLFVLVVASLLAPALGGPTGRPAEAAIVRAVHFPVAGTVSFYDDFGAPRSGGRRHEGNDLFGPKLTPVLSATDGLVVRSGLHNGRSLAGNYLVVRDGAGWEYKYIHLNNDTPGTDDGANPAAWRFAPGIGVGARVRAGQRLGYLGDSGNAEGTPPHLHFEIATPRGVSVPPWASLRAARAIPAGTRCSRATNPPSVPQTESAAGYWLAGEDGRVFAFGDAPQLGSVAVPPARPIVQVAATRTGQGYWLVADDGGVWVFGDAQHFGSTRGIRLKHAIVGMAATPSGHGYWLVAGDGGIFSYGDAGFYGSTGSMRLNKPIVGMASTPSGHGYWLVAADGGIFSYGDARFYGSTGSMRLNRPVVGMAAVPSGEGYWLVADDGGMFAFGRAPFLGSVPGTGNCGPVDVVAMVATDDGYWMAAADGRAWSFGAARDDGDPWEKGAARARVVGMAAAVRPVDN